MASQDPGWEFGFMYEPPNKNKVQCQFCGKQMHGGVTRLKQHVAGTVGNVARCKRTTVEDRNRALEMLREIGVKKERRAHALRESHTFSTFNERDELDSMVEEADPSTVRCAKKRKGKFSMDFETDRSKGKSSMGFETDRSKSQSSVQKSLVSSYFAPRTTPGSQLGIRRPMASASKKHIEEVDLCVARFVYENAIPFNVANSFSFQALADAISSAGAGYKMPSYHDLRGRLLQSSVRQIQSYCDGFKKDWEEFGCTIMTDGWTDKANRNLINFLVYCPRGTTFIESVDATDIVKTADNLFKVFKKIVHQVGPSNVVQFVTDNASNYKAAGKMLEKEFGTFFWTPCAAHCLDLMLHDIGNLDCVKLLLKDANKLTKFMYNDSRVLNLMRKHTKKNIIRPAKTRFATHFLTLQSLYAQKEALMKMFTSSEWVQSKHANVQIGKELTSLVLNSTFWDKCKNIIDICEPLVHVLRLADSEQRPSMGYMYDAMSKARERIARIVMRMKEFSPILKKIDDRWKSQLHSPLHAAGYFLNPSKFYDNKAALTTEVRSGIIDCIEKLVSSPDIQDSISANLCVYERAESDFGREMAKRNRHKMAPVEWWTQFGRGSPALLPLQKFAIRILSQTCSASGCERNWSVFDRIHTKKRNRLEHSRLNDLVFVNYNLKLKQRQTMSSQCGKGKSYLDPISMDALDITEDWVAEQDDLVIEGDASWADVNDVEDEVDENPPLNCKDTKPSIDTSTFEVQEDVYIPSIDNEQCQENMQSQKDTDWFGLNSTYDGNYDPNSWGY